MKLFDFGITDGIRTRALRKHASQAVLSLFLPLTHLVRMELMLRCNLLDCLIAAKGFQGDLNRRENSLPDCFLILLIP